MKGSPMDQPPSMYSSRCYIFLFCFLLQSPFHFSIHIFVRMTNGGNPLNAFGRDRHCWFVCICQSSTVVGRKGEVLSSHSHHAWDFFRWSCCNWLICTPFTAHCFRQMTIRWWRSYSDTLQCYFMHILWYILVHVVVLQFCSQKPHITIL